MTDENQAIIKQEADEIAMRMVDRATKRLIAAGHNPAEAYDFAVKALYSPSTFVLPAFDDL